ncbi:MAG: vanadium-dependent haloperoxidase, partial [Gammaproteobacteria bacterium]
MHGSNRSSERSFVMPHPNPNHDEDLATGIAPFIGNFHKTLPHDDYGEVDPAAYRIFERVCIEIEAGAPRNFNEVPSGLLPAGITSAAKLVSPMAGASTETLGLDPKSVEMLPAPSCLSLTTSAEMCELYWMALLRDAPLLAFQSEVTPADDCAPIDGHDTQLGYGVVARTDTALRVVNAMFDIAVRRDTEAGRLRTPTDLAGGAGGANIVKQTLFRSGLRDEALGPLVSQFFLQPIAFGTQSIDQRQVPYIAKCDFLTKHETWLLAQNTGKDCFDRDYGNCNNYSDQLHRGALYYPTMNDQPDGPVVCRYISTMRDLARFVNRDALHQAYFNAALFLLGCGAPTDAGNPYRGNRYARETGFATLGGPDLLTLVSEVASRALKVVWRQKWLVHRRARPEVIAGLIQMQRKGYCNKVRDYGLPTELDGVPAFKSQMDLTLAAVEAHNAGQNGGAGTGTFFLPMAFSAGSPSHPAYGAGHATVAGACVTVLKAWFDEDARLADVYKDYNKALQTDRTGPKDPPAAPLAILQPGHRKTGTSLEDFCEPAVYCGTDAACMTVGGELNKLASNVAMGRSMGGVHWRTDNTRSLRLGESVAIEILRKRTA